MFAARTSPDEDGPLAELMRISRDSADPGVRVGSVSGSRAGRAQSPTLDVKAYSDGRKS